MLNKGLHLMDQPGQIIRLLLDSGFRHSLKIAPCIFSTSAIPGGRAGRNDECETCAPHQRHCLTAWQIIRF